jgi:hypothetical protein
VGAKTWMLVGAAGSVHGALAAKPPLNHEATMALANRLFPDEKLIPHGAGDLSCTCPPDDEVHIGSFAGLSIVAAKEFAIDCPSRLDSRFSKEMSAPMLYLHAMHSVVDWFAFAIWKDRRLIRSLSLSPESGIIEDIGERLPFEIAYWSGDHPAVELQDEEDGEQPYPFPFHPLELGEAALKEFFGYQLEGLLDDTLLEPEEIELVRLKRQKNEKKSWFRRS